MKRYIGKQISFIKSGLPPNFEHCINVKVTDGMKNIFKTDAVFTTDHSGKLKIDSKEFEDLVGSAKSSTKKAFVIPEFNEFHIELENQIFHEKITISSGIGDTIVKEEWRDKHLGNVFYPSQNSKYTRPRGVILHLQGSAELFQDAKSVCLANEGYLVVELGYNVPKYGISLIYDSKYFPLEYIKSAIDRLLVHPKARGFTSISIMGHSKGADLALSSACMFPDLIDLAIVTCGSLAAPIFQDVVYGNKHYDNMGSDLSQFKFLRGSSDKIISLPNGMSGLATIGKELLFVETSPGKYVVNFDALRRKDFNFFDLPVAKNIHAFFTIDDPVTAPSRQAAIDYANFVFADMNHKMTLVEAGHMCSIPGIPIVESSIMRFQDSTFLIEWSRNKTEKERSKERKNVSKLYESVLNILATHYNN